MFKNLMVVSMAIMLSLVLVGSPAKAAEPSYEPQKVVYHFNQNNMKVTAGGLRNLQNHINAVGAMNLKAIAMFHGGGVFTLMNEPINAADKELAQKIQSRVLSLKQQGVEFNICANTLRGKKIDYKKDLYDVNEKDIVPSGVAEISKLQLAGYTYIKP